MTTARTSRHTRPRHLRLFPELIGGVHIEPGTLDPVTPLFERLHTISPNRERLNPEDLRIAAAIPESQLDWGDPRAFVLERKVLFARRAAHIKRNWRSELEHKTPWWDAAERERLCDLIVRYDTAQANWQKLHARYFGGFHRDSVDHSLLVGQLRRA